MQRAIIAAALVSAAANAHAQTSDEPIPPERFFIRGGPALATFDTGAQVAVAGTPVAGGEVTVRNNTGFSLEGGWFVRPNWSVSLTVGVPPTARIHGDGTLASAGLLGTVVYGPAAFGVQFHAPTIGRFRPYLGVGFDYTLVYHERGSAIGNLHVSDGNGPLVQAGVEYRVGRHAAFFFDIKKIWVAVDATGTIATPGGVLPATARLALDPVIGNTGLSWHF